MADSIFRGCGTSKHLAPNKLSKSQHYKWLIVGSTALATVGIQPAVLADGDTASAGALYGPALAVAAPQAKAKAKAAKPKKPKATSLRDAFKKGKYSLGVRYRFHTISEDAKEFNAVASTIRLRGGFRTAEYKGVSGYLEFDHTAIVGADEFNTPNVPRAGYPTIADPAITDLQQAYLDIKSFKNSELRIGRMQPSHDDKRYLGPGNWRQNARNMDGVRFINKGLKDVTLKYYYHWNFNRQFGDSIAAGDWDTNSHLFFAEYAGIKGVKVSGFGYLLKVSDDPKQSSKTFGGRIHGKIPMGGKSKFLFDSHYAKQSDYSNNANDYSEHIFWGFAGMQTGPFTAKFGYENIGGDGTNAVRFATGGRHAFQGLADIFTGIPANGLKDVYGHITYKMPDIGFMKKPAIHVQYHDFSAQNISQEYGTEWDVRFTFKTAGKLGFRVLYADFNSQGFKSDKKHFLVQINTKF